MKRISLPALTLICVLLFQPTPAKAVSAGTAGMLSIVPGLGQTVEGNPLEGLGWFVAVVGSFALQNAVPISAPVA